MMKYPRPADFDLQRDTYGAFTELNYQLSDRIQLSGSLRYDDIEDADSETTARLGLLVNLPGGNTVLRANWGEGFKLPSFFALGHALVGNPDLRPETAESWDLGLEWNLQDKLLVEANYFSNEYKELIDFDSYVLGMVKR